MGIRITIKKRMVQMIVQSPFPTDMEPGLQEAWQLVLGRLRPDMSKALFETWVEPLHPLRYHNGIATIGAANPYGRDWVDSRLKSSLARLLEGVYGTPVQVELVVENGFLVGPPPAITEARAPAEFIAGQASSVDPGQASNAGTEEAPAQAESGGGKKRKLMLQRAYGNRRAAVIQPERGMFLTLYFFNKWLPLIGHSAATIVMAARSMCYWNPLTGELRNTVETEMGELAQRAAVSVRTVKDVLANDLIQSYFLRYKVRRIMTTHGVRTAGITLQVRMDDPLTLEDQAELNLPEEEHWYAAEFDDEE